MYNKYINTINVVKLKPKKKIYHQEKDPLISVNDVTDTINAYIWKKKEEQEQPKTIKRERLNGSEKVRNKS